MTTHNIGKRLLASIFLLVMVPLLLLGIVLPWQGLVVQKEQVKKLQRELTIQASKNIAVHLEEQEHELDLVVKRNYLPKMSCDRQAGVLNKFLAFSQVQNHRHIFNEIAVIDDQGQECVRVSRTQHLGDEDLRDKSTADEFIMPLRDNKNYYSPIYFNELTGEPFITIAIPITNPRINKVQGVLASEMSLKFMWNAVMDVRVGESGSAMVVDETGRVVAHPSPSIVLLNTHFQVPGEPRIMRGINGNMVVVAAEPIPFGDQSFFFVTELPVAEAFGHIKTSLFIVLSCLLLALSGSAVLGFMMIRRIIRPIESLTAVATEISHGDFSRKAAVTSNDEFGYLAETFNKMTACLVDTINALNAEKNFVGNVIESLTHPLYVIDAHDYTIKLANSAAKFGPFARQNKCYELTAHKEKLCDGNRGKCIIRKIKQTKEPLSLEQIRLSDDNKEKIYEVHAYPIFDDQGEVSQIIEYNIDITERRHLEEQLRQAQKMEAIGSLAGGVAHDFNNLLSVILGYSEMLLLGLPPGDPLSKNARAILNAGEKASALTNQLLAFSRKQILEVKILNCNDLVEKSAKMLSRLIGDNITLRLRKAEALWNIEADPAQMDQVIINLVVNAKDALCDKEGGMVEIETANVLLDEEYAQQHKGVSPGPHVMIAVTDNGKGMTGEVREKIFEPFYTTKKGTGTGLGLSTVYGIVKQHHGHIFVYSEPVMGTTFKVYLPATREEEANIPAAAFETTERRGGGETILLVDDEASILEMAGDTLQPMGYKVLKALSGEEALELCAETDVHIDLLITDVIMKGMNGRQLADALVAISPRTKVIFMSGYTENLIAGRGVLEEGVNFIQKPVRPGNLLLKIRQILDNNS